MKPRARGADMPVAGGVASAIEQCVKAYYPGVDVKIEHAEGLDACKKVLILAKLGKKNGCLIEGMGCPGGCVAGAGTNLAVEKATAEVKKIRGKFHEETSAQRIVRNRFAVTDKKTKIEKRKTTRFAFRAPNGLTFYTEKIKIRHGFSVRKRSIHIHGRTEEFAGRTAAGETSSSKLGTQPVGKLLLKLSIPTITAQLVNALYNIVDRIYIGHMPDSGSYALTAMGVCLSLIMIISAFAYLTAIGGAAALRL